MPDPSGKKKIMFVINSLAGGGAEKVLIDIVNFLDPDGYDIALVVFQGGGAHRTRVPAHVTVHDLKKVSRFSFPKLIIRLFLLLRKTSPDTAISFMSYNSLILIVAGLLLLRRPRIVFTEHEYVSAELAHTRLAWLKRSLYGAFYKYADVYVVPARAIGKDITALFHLDPAKVVFIPNPVDLAALDRLKEEEGGCPEGPFILTVGRLNPSKGYTTLLDAYARISGTIEEKLVILGEGELEEELKNRAKDLGIAARVLFLGFQANPYKYMRRASLLVSSSLWESFALVIVEGMASGVPVVATDCPVGPREIITDGVDGVLVPPADAAALAAALLRVLKDEELKKKMREAGRSRAKDFGLEKIVPEFEKVL